ncbi:MAG: sigma factor-like helix-turn-helix DNA-binding protein [Ilumatobacteraceae bacterium]
MDDSNDGRSGEAPTNRRRRQWVGLASATGFERCVRESLREVYGYVALLVGRDRHEAEQRVGDLYRSLFRSVRSGHTEAVSLGMLRTAARRSWLEDHFIEIVSVFEVAGNPVATIAELSAIERAAIVLRYVNEMSLEAVALELGRSERDVAAVEAHAVRRLRGTDETSGAWIRAYLGPTVTPAPGAIDRIIDRLSREPVPEPVSAPVSAPAPVPEPAPVPVPDPVPAPAPVPESDPVPAPDPVPESDPVPDPVPEFEWAPETAAVLEAQWAPEPVAQPDLAPEPTEVPRPVIEHDPIEHDLIEHGMDADRTGRRPRWVVAVGAALVAALLGSVTVLLLRGSTDTTIAVTVTTLPAVPSTSEVVASTVAPAVEPVDDASGGFDPPCVERSGGSSTAIDWPDQFDVLGASPTLTVRLPRSVDAATGAVSLPVDVAARPSSNGLIVAVRTDERAVDRTILASFGLDGTVGWVRCLTGRLDIGADPESGIALVVRDRTTGSGWAPVSIEDGTIGPSIDAVGSARLDERFAAESAATAAPGAVVDGSDVDGADVTVGFSYDGDSGRSVLAGLVDGSVSWALTDVVLPDDGFRYAVVDEVVMVRSCPDSDGETVSSSDPAESDDPAAFTACPGGELRGYALGSGDLLWTRSGDRSVAVIADGGALVGDSTGWELLEVATGEARAERRWDDPATFPLGADLGSIQRVGGAVVVVGVDVVTVWLPDGVGGPAASVDLG